MSGLDWPGAIDDVKACATWLKANGCSKVVVVGFCMGGALSLGSAVQLGEVDACIAFYGWNQQLGDVSTVSIQMPSHILLVFVSPHLFARVCDLRETRDENLNPKPPSKDTRSQIYT
jgi:dienelactone hydrolase